MISGIDDILAGYESLRAGQEAPYKDLLQHPELSRAEHRTARRDRWHGTLITLFQPTEKTGEGAWDMVDDGLFKRIPVPDVALAQRLRARRRSVSLVTHCSAGRRACLCSLGSSYSRRSIRPRHPIHTDQAEGTSCAR